METTRCLGFFGGSTQGVSSEPNFTLRRKRLEDICIVISSVELQETIEPELVLDIIKKGFKLARLSSAFKKLAENFELNSEGQRLLKKMYHTRFSLAVLFL